VFRLHDLIREYAAALAAELPGPDRNAAVVRALDFELHAARATAEGGDPAAAEEIFRQALALASTHNQPVEQARARTGLGDCLAGDPAAAREHYREAHRIYARLDVPQRLDAERRLAALVPVGG